MTMSSITNSILLGVVVYLLYDKYTNIPDTESNPVDFMNIKHVTISNYSGPMNGETLILFKNVETFELIDNHFPIIVEDIFNSLKNMKRMYMRGNRIEKEVFADISSCCTKMKELILDNSGASGFSKEEWEKIGEMSALEKIYMTKEKIADLGSNLLKNKHLKELNLEFNGFSKIEDGAFNHVGQLEILILRGNKITQVTKQLLTPLRKLKVLDVSYNLLEKFDARELPSMPNLEKIDISYNPIQHFNLEEVKTLLPKLKEVDVSGISGIDTLKIDGVKLVRTEL